jgi:hypothetical protein
MVHSRFNCLSSKALQENFGLRRSAMFALRARTAALTVAASVGLAACATPYGYGGVGVGYGSGYDGYGGYGYPAGAYGYGYEPYWGWYDDYYYPGTGYYVYDRYRRPYPWNDDHRRHWEGRRDHAMSTEEFRRRMETHRDEQNWSGFEQGPTQVQRAQRVRQGDRAVTRVERSNRSQRVERSTNRTERSSSRSEKSNSRGKQNSSDFRRSMEDRD